jgi:hypothetical protein
MTLAICAAERPVNAEEAYGLPRASDQCSMVLLAVTFGTPFSS